MCVEGVNGCSPGLAWVTTILMSSPDCHRDYQRLLLEHCEIRSDTAIVGCCRVLPTLLPERGSVTTIICEMDV